MTAPARKVLGGAPDGLRARTWTPANTRRGTALPATMAP